MKLLDKLDTSVMYRNKVTHCEVMLSKHALYPATGGALLPGQKLSALDIRLWLLFLCDGKTGLYEISNKLDVPIEILDKEARERVSNGVMETALLPELFVDE